MEKEVRNHLSRFSLTLGAFGWFTGIVGTLGILVYFIFGDYNTAIQCITAALSGYLAGTIASIIQFILYIDKE